MKYAILLVVLVTIRKQMCFSQCDIFAPMNTSINKKNWFYWYVYTQNAFRVLSLCAFSMVHLVIRVLFIVHQISRSWSKAFLTSLSFHLKMFLVIYSIGSRTFLVIPAKWVKNHEKVMEKSMNYSINTNQVHRCFFTNNIDENGQTDAEPNFHAQMANEVLLDGECCFLGLLVKFFGELL